MSEPRTDLDQVDFWAPQALPTSWIGHPVEVSTLAACDELVCLGTYRGWQYLRERPGSFRVFFDGFAVDLGGRGRWGAMGYRARLVL